MSGISSTLRGAIDDLREGMKGNRKLGETKAPLDGFRSFRRFPPFLPSHSNSNYIEETVVTSANIKARIPSVMCLDFHSFQHRMRFYLVNFTLICTTIEKLL